MHGLLIPKVVNVSQNLTDMTWVVDLTPSLHMGQKKKFWKMGDFSRFWVCLIFIQKLGFLSYCSYHHHIQISCRNGNLPCDSSLGIYNPLFSVRRYCIYLFNAAMNLVFCIVLISVDCNKTYHSIHWSWIQHGWKLSLVASENAMKFKENTTPNSQYISPKSVNTWWKIAIFFGMGDLSFSLNKAFIPTMDEFFEVSGIYPGFFKPFALIQ